MPILKFARSYDAIVLKKLLMMDITKDQRTSLLNLSDFICQKYKVDTNVYIAKNDMFFKMAKMLNTSRIRIDAMIIHEGKNNIIIVPTRSYVFWNGRSIEPETYHILQTEENMRIQNQLRGNAV